MQERGGDGLGPASCRCPEVSRGRAVRAIPAPRRSLSGIHPDRPVHACAVAPLSLKTPHVRHGHRRGSAPATCVRPASVFDRPRCVGQPRAGPLVTRGGGEAGNDPPGDALLAVRRRQTFASGPLSGGSRSLRRRGGRRDAAGLRGRVHSHLLAGSRRPARHGQR